MHPFLLSFINLLCAHKIKSEEYNKQNHLQYTYTKKIKKHTTMKLFQALIIPTLIIATSAAPPSPSRQYLRREPQPQEQVRDGVQFDPDDFQDDTVTFDDPTHHDMLLDYCLTFKNECGKPAADAYCAAKDYGEAIEYPMRRTYNQPTLTIKDQATCSPAHNSCDTFDYIICKVNEQTYYEPKENNYALDGCLGHSSGCGDDAANAFCTDQGYSEAKDYELVQALEMTMAIGDQAVCDPNWHECTTFSFITCIATKI